MNATTTNTLNRYFNSVLASLLIVLFTSVTFAGKPVVQQTGLTAPQTVESLPTNEILPAAFELKILHTDEGMPLAREDVTPIHTALTGSGGGGIASTDEAQLKISGRAADANMRSFLARASMTQLGTVYNEISQMIDSRHVNPPSYQDRTTGAITVVIKALQNETWLRMNNVNANPQTISSVQNQLWQLAQSQPAQRSSDAVGLMQTAAELVSRSLGVRREAVALEFVNGTIDSLDKYSAFMPATNGSSPVGALDMVQTANLNENIVGIGVELKSHARGVEIVDIIDNGPAARLGLRPGDVIVAVDMQEMAGRTLNEVADRIGGRAGSTVTVDVVRDGQRLRGTLARQQVYVSSVSGTRMIDAQNGVGYTRLKQFSKSSKADLEKALWNLHQQGMKSLVLDLRGNPGGLLDVSIEVSDLFLPYGTIVATQGRTASDNSRETATYDNTWSTPLVVLIDEGSASASEIFAAAIQENRRGVIVGQNSYGKGTVQTHFPMRTVSATLKLTTANFYSPTGRQMAGQGVAPDVPVPNTTNAAARGTANDQDLQTALAVIRQGQPGALAAQAGNGQVPNSSPAYNTMPGFPQPSLTNYRQY